MTRSDEPPQGNGLSIGSYDVCWAHVVVLGSSLRRAMRCEVASKWLRLAARMHLTWDLMYKAT